MQVFYGALLSFGTDDDTAREYRLSNPVTLSRNIGVTDPDDTDYFYIVNQNQFGIRFHRYAKTNLVSVATKTINHKTQYLEIQGEELPIYYNMDETAKTGEYNLSFWASTKAAANRLKLLLKTPLIYLYCPRSWNRNIDSGFYSFTEAEFSPSGKQGKYLFTISGLRQVFSDQVPADPVVWNYDTLRNFIPLGAENTYSELLEYWEDYANLRDNW
jgi:hypothetical protein